MLLSADLGTEHLYQLRRTTFDSIYIALLVQDLAAEVADITSSDSSTRKIIADDHRPMNTRGDEFNSCHPDRRGDGIERRGAGRVRCARA